MLELSESIVALSWKRAKYLEAKIYEITYETGAKLENYICISHIIYIWCSKIRLGENT